MTAPKPSRHALLSPSSAYKWTTCAGSVALEKLANNPDTAGRAASEGTFMHHVAATALEQGKNADAYLGYQETVDGIDFTFDSSHQAIVQTYIDTVRSYAGHDGELFIEQELDISWLTGEPGAVGTADAIVVRGGELIVIDLKTGRNHVEAKNNHQLFIYSMAALKAYNEGTLTKPNPPVDEAGPFYWSHPESSHYGMLPTRADMDVLLHHEPLAVEISADEYAKLTATAEAADLF